MFNVSELDEFYEEDMMISNTTVVPHVEKWETVKCSFVVKKKSYHFIFMEISYDFHQTLAGNTGSEDYRSFDDGLLHCR